MGIYEMKIAKQLAAMLAAVLVMLPVMSLGEREKQETVKGGKLTEERWVDEAGTLTPGPEGWARVQYAHTKEGITEMYFDADGAPFEMPGGYFGRAMSYDNKKRVTGITYLDETGEKKMNHQGYARIRMEYTSFGETKYIGYYGLDGKLIQVPSLGYASVRTDFRGKTMTKRSYLDEKGELTDTPLGYAAMVQKVNKKNHVMSISFEHADGSAATCADGWSLCEKERDKDGRELCSRYYDAAGNLTDRGAAWAWTETDYNDKDEALVTRFALDGQKVDMGGYITLKQKLRDGRVIKESFLDEEKNAVVNSDGVGTISYDYDHEGRLWQVTYQNLSGENCVSAQGYAGYRDSFDDEGKVIGRLYLGTDGKAAELAEGYCEIRYSYDESGRISGTRYYNAEGLEVGI